MRTLNDENGENGGGARPSDAFSSERETQDAASAFEIRGTTCPVASLRLLNTDLRLVAEQFSRLLEKRYALFRGAPLVIDLTDVRYGAPLDMDRLVRLLRELGFTPVAVTGGGERHNDQAAALGLGQVQKLRPTPDAQAASAAKAEPQAQAAPAEEPGRPKAPARPQTPGEGSTMFVGQPVRSGQKIYATGRSLVLLGAVSPGAEVLADGDIHAYGPLRGRVLAGARGAEDARVFCQRLEAELVSVAGYYLTVDDMPPELRGKPAMVWLENGQLRIKALP